MPSEYNLETAPESEAMLFVDAENVRAAEEEVQGLGGRVTHRFGNSFLIARMPEPLDCSRLNYASPDPCSSLDISSRLAADAWKQNLAIRDTPHAPGPQEGVAWDAPAYNSPISFDEDPRIGESFAEDDDEGFVGFDEDETGIQPSSGTPTSLYLVGSVAVGLIVVSRDTGPEQMDMLEQTTVVQQAQQGLDFLANAEQRANLSFVYDIRPVTVDVAPGPLSGVSGPYERFERPWRDAALAQMGFSPGRDGYRAYVADLKQRMGTDWAFVAFFTKYPLNHFAYAIWEKVVMHYDNDGWGTDSIHRVFAHESCHIFGAADEYGSCSCGSLHGHLQAPNANCVNCFPPGNQVACLMNQNTLTLCEHSRRQIGWDPSLYPATAPARNPNS